MLDPIADKIIVATALILLVMAGTIKNYEVIAAIIILTREILISGLREFLAIGKKKLPVSNLAKAKTFLQMVAISALLTGEPGNKIINFQAYTAQTLGIILLWLSAFQSSCGGTAGSRIRMMLFNFLKELSVLNHLI